MLENKEITSTIKNRINDIEDNFFNNSISISSNKPAIGWFCTYTPEELITAGGLIPLRISSRKKIVKSEGYFPINFCPYIKSSWESLLTDTSTKNIKGLIFTNSCDGMRRFFDVANKYLKNIPSYLLDVPHLKDKDSIDFFSGNIAQMKLFIERLKGGKIKEEEIKKAVYITNSKRKFLKEFSCLLNQLSNIVNISTYYKIMELAMTSESEAFTHDLEKYLRFIKKASTENKSSFQSDNKKSLKSPPIMIIGNFIAENKLWDVLSTMNLRVASDDLCISSRYYEKQVKSVSNSDSLWTIAERYLTKPPCMRMADLGFKLSEIKSNIIKNDIKGVLFISLKFCDTMLYFFPLLKRKLSEMGIPILYLELEYNNFSEGQIKTRIQAFLEML